MPETPWKSEVTDHRVATKRQVEQQSCDLQIRSPGRYKIVIAERPPSDMTMAILADRFQLHV